MTTSSGRQGRSAPVSASVTGYPSRSSRSIRSAAKRASARGRFTGGASLSRFTGTSSRWNSVWQSVRSGRKSAPKWRRSAWP